MPETYEIPVRLDLSGARKDAAALDRILAGVEDRQEQAARRKEQASARAAERQVQAAERAAAREAAAEARKQAQLERVQDEFLRRDYRRRVNYEAMLEREAQRARSAAASGMAAGAREAGLFERAALGVATRLAGVATAGLALHQGVGYLRDMREEAARMARDLIGAKDALRSLAGVMDERPTTEFVLENALFAAEAGMRPGEAKDFREQFRGRAQIVAGNTISQEGFARFEQLAAGMAAAKGIPAEMAGDLFGGILKAENFANKGLAGPEEEAAAAGASAAKLFRILDASSAPMPIATHQASQLMAFVSENNLESTLRSSADVAVLIGAMSELNPGEAFTMASRGIQGLTDFRDEDKAGFFSRTGIKPGMDAIEMFRRSNRFIADEVAKGKTVDQAIADAGFKDIRELRAMAGAYLSRDKVFEPFARMAEEPGDMAAAGALVSEHLASPQGVMAAGEATLEAQRARQGMRTEAFEARIPGAQARVLARHGTARPWWATVATGFGLLGDPERLAAETQLAEDAGVRGAQKIAGPVAGMLMDVWGWASGGVAERANAAFGGSDAVESATAERLVRALDRNATALERRQGPAPPPPPLARRPANQGGAP